MRHFIAGLALTFIAFPAFASHNININTADHATLTTLTGIGDVKAAAIIDYRNGPDGPFETKEEIMEVSGIGSATFENIKGHIVVSGGTSTLSEEDTEPKDDESGEGTEESVAEPPPEDTSGGGGFVKDTMSIYVDAGNNRAVFVGADSAFRAVVTGNTGDLIEGARVVWSFGNGDRREGRNILYNFAYPGEYVVVVDASNDVYSATDRITVTAIPANIIISDVTNEYIALHNKTTVEVDVGGWLLFASGRQFRFPEHTILAAGHEVLVSNKRTGLSGANPATVALQYPNGLVATTYRYPLFLTTRRTTPSVSAAPAKAGAGGVSAPPLEPQSLPAAGEPVVNRNDLITSPIAAVDSHALVDGTGIPPIIPWLAALILLIAGAVGGVLYVRGSEYNKYAIMEIKE